MKHKRLIAIISAALLILSLTCCLAACNNDGENGGEKGESTEIILNDEQMTMLKNMCLIAIDNGGECGIGIFREIDWGINSYLTFRRGDNFIGFSYACFNSDFSEDFASALKKENENSGRLFTIGDNWYCEADGITYDRVKEYASDALTSDETNALDKLLGGFKNDAQGSVNAALLINEEGVTEKVKFSATAISQSGAHNTCAHLVVGKDEAYLTAKEAEMNADTQSEITAGIINADSNVKREKNLLLMTHYGNYIPMYSDNEDYFYNYEENAGTYAFTGYQTCSLISGSHNTYLHTLGCPSEVMIAEEYNGKPVTEIFNFSIIYRSSIEKLYIPASVNTFQGSQVNIKLKCIEVSPDNAVYKNSADKRCLMTKDGKSFLMYAINSGKEFTIPDGVTEIKDWSFEFAAKLEKISLPSSLVSIGENAFYACYGLKSVVIPANVKYIGSGIFESCYALETIYCEAAEKPVGWDDNWNMSGANVVWGHKG